MEEEKLIKLYQSTFNAIPKLDRLPGAGSNRHYYCLTAPRRENVIGVVGTSEEENEAFCSLSSYFEQQQLPTPRVFAVSEDRLAYLQEDLGTQSLFDAIKKGRDQGGKYDKKEEELLRQTISKLPDIQFKGNSETVFSHCYPLHSMDAQSVAFDLNYFKYCFLKLTGLEFNELSLEKDFYELSENLLCVDECAFQYRDFQARNVMLKDGAPYFIDYQGGRKGPIFYDVASFLWQASAAYSNELRMRLIDAYLEALKPYLTIEKADFLQKLRPFVIFRNLQVLGAYGYRGLWEKKPHFQKSIPNAIKNLGEALENVDGAKYPYIRLISKQLSDRYAVPTTHASDLLRQDANYVSQEHNLLTVTIFSFSFKKGIPADESGNGGGYVFDCRSTHNPGRYQEYKQLTGLDQPVIQFLEEDGEILTFLESVYRLADFHVQRFLDRGFTHLQFAFGCTGGQHRSVYSAQHLAEHLHQRFPVKIYLIHREQQIEQTFSPQ